MLHGDGHKFTNKRKTNINLIASIINTITEITCWTSKDNFAIKTNKTVCLRHHTVKIMIILAL